MKKYLFFAVALLGMASCAKEDVDNGNKPIHSGEIEESYIAINLSASDITRAQTGFDDGTDAERAVNHADFFFFDEYGNPFPVQVNGDTTSQGGEINHLSATEVDFDEDSNTGDDISDTSNPVLLLKTYKGQYPSQIVAVLNWNPESKAYSLQDLYQAVNITTSVSGNNYFVMSNSAYANGTTEVCATPLTNENIKTTEADALSAPVNIYVERVAAKVQVNSTDVNKYNVKEGSDLYATILSWDLYRDNTQSKLLKDIDASWTDLDLGFAWNNGPWYRSYWATSLSAPTDDKIFDTSSPLAAGAFTYIGENTTGKATCTKVVIKAQLVNGAGAAQEIAIWNNVEYVSAPNSGESLRTAVANTLKYKYFAKTGDGETAKYTGLKPDDLQCVKGGAEGAPTGVAANEVYFQLSTAGEGKNWYKLVNGEYLPVANDTANDPNSINATNEALKSVPAALLYENGETFYYVDIKHLGNGQGKPGDYGIVRNHVYNITINSITGYGSPVYTGVSFLDYPQINEQGTYVSAKINILSWKLVNQQVDIKPGN